MSKPETRIRGPQGQHVDGLRQARETLEQQLQRNPEYADLHQRLGLLHLAAKDTERATESFSEALGIHPGYRAAYYGLRLAQIWEGRLDAAAEPSAPAGEASPSARAAEELWAVIDAAYREHAADRDPVPVLGQLPEPVRQHYRAAFALARGTAQDAAAALTACSEASATSAELLRAWKLLPADASRVEAAQALFGQLLWTPLASELYSFLGRIYARNGMRAEALDAFGRAYLVWPQASAYARHRAEIAIAFGEEGHALKLLQAAVDADPEDTQARIALGFEYAAQGFTTEARDQFEAAAEREPNYADVRYNLALLYVAAGRDPAALEQFRAALGINPTYLPARHSMASLLCRLGRHEEGLREYERILRLGFQSADMLVQMGKAALDLGRSDEALQYLERAGFLNPDYPLGHYYLGRVYQAKGWKRKAQSAWRSYLTKANRWEPQSLPTLPTDAENGD